MAPDGISGATCAFPFQPTIQEEPVKFTVDALSKTLSRAVPTKALGLFREDLVTAQRRDPAATSALEIALTYPGVKSVTNLKLNIQILLKCSVK